MTAKVYWYRFYDLEHFFVVKGKYYDAIYEKINKKLTKMGLDWDKNRVTVHWED